MNSEKLKDLATGALNGMKGQNIACLDVGELTSFADYMLVVTGTSSRHVKSLAEELSVKAKEAGLPPPKVEGEEQGDWILLDLGDVIVHVMQAETRKLYDLESLWAMVNSKEK